MHLVFLICMRNKAVNDLNDAHTSIFKLVLRDQEDGVNNLGIEQSTFNDFLLSNKGLQDTVEDRYKRLISFNKHTFSCIGGCFSRCNLAGKLDGLEHFLHS